MIQAAPNHREVVDDIVEILIARFHPRRIYLFGSRARGDAKPLSDYDFLMELDTRPEGVPMLGSIIWLEDFGAIEIQVHTRPTGALERRKDDPGCVDWDVVREGKLLFTDGSLPAVLPAPDRGVVREPRRDPPKTLREWVRLADQDLRLARHLSSNLKEWKEPICFHCQQTVEKFLKALVISQRKPPLETHNLKQLLIQVRQFGFRVPNIDRDCWPLTRYAVRARYPDDDEWLIASEPSPVISEADAQRALAAAERIVKVIRDELP